MGLRLIALSVLLGALAAPSAATAASGGALPRIAEAALSNVVWDHERYAAFVRAPGRLRVFDSARTGARDVVIPSECNATDAAAGRVLLLCRGGAATSSKLVSLASGRLTDLPD